MWGTRGEMQSLCLVYAPPLPPAFTRLSVQAASRGNSTKNRQKQAQEVLEVPRATGQKGCTILQGDKGREGFAKEKVIIITSPGRGTPGEALREPGLQ